MNMIFVLVMLSLVLVIAAVWAIHWAINKNQFDDLDSPAYSILEDDTPADRYQRRQQQAQQRQNEEQPGNNEPSDDSHQTKSSHNSNQ